MPGTGELIVRRDSGFYGAGCDYIIRIDGKFAANLDAGQELTVYPPAGEHSIEVTTGGYFCGNSNAAGTTANLKVGARQVYRVGQRNMSMFAELQEQTQGADELVRESLGPSMTTNAISTPKPKTAPLGTDSFQVERLPEVRQCASPPTAVLTAKGPGYETFTVACTNGEALAVRCELGNCRVLR